MMLLGSIRCGLGCWPQLYRLWSFNQKYYHYFEGKPIKHLMQALLEIDEQSKCDVYSPTAIRAIKRKINGDFIKNMI
jgi:hypothetical protein